jgi:predicted RNA-binding protein
MKIYEYIQQLETYQDKNKLIDFKGSKKELEELLIKYDIKEHNCKIVSDEKRGFIYIYNHYILTKKNNTQL